MKRMTCLLLLAAFFAGGLPTSVVADEESRATHVPFIEYATATWCGYCKYAHGALKELYAEGNHDFYYISLVTDKVAKAQQRAVSDYNVYGYPTAYFDGGFRVDVGAGSIPGAKAAYNTSLNLCEARAVNDVDIKVTCDWFGDGAMSVCAFIKNNGIRTYSGHVRVFVTEIESSMGWNDTAGNPYTFPMLDYAINEAVNIPVGDTWGLCVTWDGKVLGYPNIQLDNIMVIGAVYDGVKHQGYSYPPSTKPFDAYYVDDTAGTVPHTLTAGSETVPETGGSVFLSLYGGVENANRDYLMLGGLTGTSPGYVLPGGTVLPINWDAFTDLALSLVNTAVFKDFLGTLDGSGTNFAQLNVPPLPPGMVGTVLYFAYALNNPFDFASTPVEIEVVP